MESTQAVVTPSLLGRRGHSALAPGGGSVAGRAALYAYQFFNCVVSAIHSFGTHPVPGGPEQRGQQHKKCVSAGHALFQTDMSKGQVSEDDPGAERGGCWLAQPAFGSGSIISVYLSLAQRHQSALSGRRRGGECGHGHRHDG
jgi:hypothetical protein